MRKIILSMFILLLIALITGCATQTVSESTFVVEEEVIEVPEVEEVEETVEEPEEEIEVVSTNPVIEIDVVAKQWEFEPSTIRVNEGNTVRLKITSIDVEHGIRIPQFGISENLAPGEEVTIEFVADKKGTFPFVCSVFCGSGHSTMSGEIVIE